MLEWSQEQIEEYRNQNEPFLLYLYTPLCGTCQVASKMVTITAELFPSLRFGKSNLNYIPNLAVEWEVESVPCLIMYRSSNEIKKIYAFHSIPYLQQIIKELQ